MRAGASVSTQLLQFFSAALLGSAVGLLYDGERALLRRGLGRTAQTVLDILFAAAAVGGVFFLVMTGDGEVRLFLLLGVFLGAVLHFSVLSREIAPILDFWLGIFLFPLRLFEKFVGKVKESSKKLFSFCRK